MLQVGSFTITPHNEAGYLDTSLEATYSNDTDATVRLLHTVHIPLTAEGMPVRIDSETTHVRMDHGDVVDLVPAFNGFLANELPNGIEGMRLRLITSSYGRTHFTLGEMPLPVTPGVLPFRPAMPVPAVGDDLCVFVTVVPDEDDTDFFVVSWKCLLSNASGTASAWATVKADLLDDEGVEITTDSTTLELPARWPGLLRSCFERLTLGQLRGSVIRFSLSVFPLIATVTTEAVATVEERQEECWSF